MELILILRVILRRWWLVAIPVVIVAATVVPEFLRERGTTAGGFNVTLRYTAAQSTSNVAPRDGDYQDVWLASELAVNALTDWVRSSSFREEINAALGGTVELGALGIAADNSRSVGQLAMSYPSAAELEQITQAAMQVMQERAQIYFPQLGGESAQVTFLDSPAYVPAPPALANRFAPFVRIGIALVAGVLLAFLWEYLDPFVRRREQVEAMGVTVMASIPRQ